MARTKWPDPSGNTRMARIKRPESNGQNQTARIKWPKSSDQNQTAIKIHTQPGDQLICDHFSHIFNYEGGGVSFNSGVSCSLIEGDRGRMCKRRSEAELQKV